MVATEGASSRRREANHDASFDSLRETQQIVPQIQTAWPRVKIILRGNSGFCRNELMSQCEAYQVDFLFGVARHQRLPSSRLKAGCSHDWLPHLFCYFSSRILMFLNQASSLWFCSEIGQRVFG
jgi:hypothetical protein